MSLRDGVMLSVNTKWTLPPATAAEEEMEEPLSPVAKMFVTPGLNCCGVMSIGCGKRIDVDVVKAGLEATVVHHPRFSSVLVADNPGDKTSRWVRTKVIVEDHLVVPDLDPATFDVTPDKVVEDYISSLSTTNLKPSRPLWEIHILNFPTSTAEAVAVFRSHHSLGDCTSLTSLLLACTTKTSDPTSLPTMPRTRRPAPANRRTAGLRDLVLWAWAAMVLAWHTLVDLHLFVVTAAFLRDTETPLKGGEGVEFRKKRFVHRTVSLDDVKAVKNAMSCVSCVALFFYHHQTNIGDSDASCSFLQTINDVLVGVTSAGLSRYLNRSFHQENDVKKKKSKTGLPANIRLRTILMVNIRPEPGIHDLEEIMKGDNSRTRWGNCISYVVLQFPIAAYQDPLEYIRRAKVIAERKKNSLAAIFIYTCAYWIDRIIGIKIAFEICYRVVRSTTMTFSNVIGPVEEVGFFGHPLIYLAPSVYGHPHALTVHFHSYKNELTMVLAVDELTILNPHQLLEDLVESVKLIKDAVSTRS